MRSDLIPGHNVDKLDIAAGLRALADCGYDDPKTQMVIENALMRWERGEEPAAQRGAIDQTFHGVNLTSWYRIVSAAITESASASVVVIEPSPAPVQPEITPPLVQWAKDQEVKRAQLGKLAKRMAVQYEHRNGPAQALYTFDFATLMRLVQAAAPVAQAEPVAQRFLTEGDFADLFSFNETSDDGEGYSIGKESVRRLASLGVLQNLNFGHYGMTAFGYFVLETVFLQNPSLPLLLNSDRDKAQRDRLAAMKGTP